jgi:hypothetical protein
MSGTRAERRCVERDRRMAEGFKRRRLDPLAVRFGRVMSDPAMRERCLALKVGGSTAAEIADGVVVTRLKGGELAIWLHD